MFSKKTIKDIDVRGKRVLVRVDFNVPIDGESVVDDTRVRAAMPTLRYLVDHGARVIIASHLGRPNGVPDLKYSLKPVRRTLQRLLGRNVFFAPETVGQETTESVERLIDGEVLMLENLRFNPGEKANDPEFAKQLASLADIYVRRRIRCGPPGTRIDRRSHALPARRTRVCCSRAKSRRSPTCSPIPRVRSSRSSAAARSATSSASSTV